MCQIVSVGWELAGSWNWDQFIQQLLQCGRDSATAKPPMQQVAPGSLLIILNPGCCYGCSHGLSVMDVTESSRDSVLWGALSS